MSVLTCILVYAIPSEKAVKKEDATNRPFQERIVLLAVGFPQTRLRVVAHRQKIAGEHPQNGIPPVPQSTRRAVDRERNREHLHSGCLTARDQRFFGRHPTVFVAVDLNEKLLILVAFQSDFQRVFNLQLAFFHSFLVFHSITQFSFRWTIIK